MVETELKKDYAYCEKVIKASSKSFYTAFSKLPKEKARAVYAIYAFCRQADDTVDAHKPLALKKENIAILEAELEEFEKGKTPNHPMWRALKDYNYYVAGSVGLMLLPILAAKNGITETLKESAVSLGIAMQITNILRDVGEDYRENKRVYLPTELLNRYQVDLAQNVENGPDKNFIALWEELAEESTRGYMAFEDSIHHYDSDCRFPVLVSSKLYSGIMDSVRKNNYDCLGKRNYVPEARMMELILETRKILKKR